MEWKWLVQGHMARKWWRWYWKVAYVTQVVPRRRWKLSSVGSGHSSVGRDPQAKASMWAVLINLGSSYWRTVPHPVGP
jgi:hypothetical protein